MKDIFGFKQRKRERQQRKEELKKEKEIKIRVSIKKKLNTLKSQADKLNTFKSDYIKRARIAALGNNQQTYNLAKQGLRLCITKQKFLESMIANFEIALQMNEMNKVISEFISGMNLISEEMKDITTSSVIAKVQVAYEKSLVNNENQYEALDCFMKDAEANIDSVNNSGNEISDDELDKLISDQSLESESDIDYQLDDKINEIRENINYN